MKAPQEPCDLARALVGLRCQRIRRARQFVPQVAVRETVQGVFTQQEHFEEHAVIARQGIECGDGSSIFRLCLGCEVIEIPHRQGRVLYLAQGFQVSGVALRRDLAISEQQRHALAQGYPRHHITAFPAYPLANPKLLRIVDHRLHPQYRRSDGSRTVAGCRVTVAPGYSLLLHLARGRGLGLWDLTFAPLRQDWQSDALEGNP